MNKPNMMATKMRVLSGLINTKASLNTPRYYVVVGGNVVGSDLSYEKASAIEGNTLVEKMKNVQSYQAA